MCSLSIFRYLTDHILSLPLSAMTRILNTNDMLGNMSILLERSPWFQRSSKKKKIQRWEGEWREIDMENAEAVGKIEGQVWLSLYNLLVEPECRKVYEYDERRKETVLKVCSVRFSIRCSHAKHYAHE